MGSPGRPLHGVRVVELSTTVLGPFCGLLLAELGADVIKIESPAGDVNRQLVEGRSPGMSSQFLNFNFGKRSAVFDLTHAPARQALGRVLASADVFFHNSRTAAVERLGLGYEQVRACRPDIVYCALLGFGNDSPYAGRPAYDDSIQAMSGLAALQGVGRGLPQYVVTTLCDKTVAQAAASAICAALVERERTGRGQAIEVPMYELMAAYALHEQLGQWTFDPPLGPIGYPRTLSPMRRPYRAQDGYISLTLITPSQWTAFFELAGRPEVLADARFSTASRRTANIDALFALVEEAVAARTVAEWLEVLGRAQIPAAAVATLEDVVLDPYLNSAGVLESSAHHTEGRLRRVRQPWRFSGAPPPPLRDAPRLGEDTRDVLREVGFDSAELADLQASGAISSDAGSEAASLTQPALRVTAADPSRCRFVQQAIARRRSVRRFDTRRVDRAVIERLLDSAVQAPNHRRTIPWRFFVVDGPGRARDELAQLAYEAALGRAIDADDSGARQRAENKRREVLDSPLVILIYAVAGRTDEETRENYAAVACGVQNLMLAAVEEELASGWSTGGLCKHPRLATLIGADPSWELVSLLFVGHPSGELGVAIERPRADKLTRWLSDDWTA
jgi:crotonobetainyl-CoA:carnitine CoA-transferase CaiB-like acyl-CoA transferase/nitroreductase